MSYFRAHEAELNALVDLGQKHAALLRAEPALSRFANFYSPPTADDLKAQEQAYRILKAIDADYVAWWRNEDGGLFEVTIPVYRYGLSLGGYSKGLEYVVDFKNPPAKSDRRSFTQIGNSPWFIESSDTR